MTLTLTLCQCVAQERHVSLCNDIDTVRVSHTKHYVSLCNDTDTVCVAHETLSVCAMTLTLCVSHRKHHISLCNDTDTDTVCVAQEASWESVQ